LNPINKGNYQTTAVINITLEIGQFDNVTGTNSIMISIVGMFT